jgi:hypothetical protein
VLLELGNLRALQRQDSLVADELYLDALAVEAEQYIGNVLRSYAEHGHLDRAASVVQEVADEPSFARVTQNRMYLQREFEPFFTTDGYS